MLIVTPLLALLFFVIQVYFGELLHYALFPMVHVPCFQERNLILLSKSPSSVISRVYPASSTGNVMVMSQGLIL